MGISTNSLRQNLKSFLNYCPDNYPKKIEIYTEIWFDRDCMEEGKQHHKSLIHELEPRSKRGKSLKNPMTKPLIFTVVIMILLGIGTGYIASSVSGNSRVTVSNSGQISSSEIKKGFTAGVSNTKQFPDTAEGVLKEGGVEGEGAFHLVRPGGDSQNVYLTSAVVDLSQFIDKKIKVWGQTQAAKHAGWLMDVGKIEVE